MAELSVPFMGPKVGGEVGWSTVIQDNIFGIQWGRGASICGRLMGRGGTGYGRGMGDGDALHKLGSREGEPTAQQWGMAQQDGD
jgi:hypothetical protein